MLAVTNTLGAVVSILFYLSAIFVFLFQMLHRPLVGRIIGYF
jgi:hypothetical protein